MKKIWSLVIALGTLLTFNFAAGAQTGGAQPAPAPENTTEGLLYRISGNGLKTPSYLFGTIHVICPNDMFGVETLRARFAETERLILELDMDDAETLGKMATSLNVPADKNLKNLLTPEKYAKVDELFRNTLGVPVAALGNIGPTGLSVIATTTAKSTGCQLPQAYETKLVEFAMTAKKPVEGLETIDDQLAALNKQPLEKQAEDLYKLALEPDKTIGSFKRLLDVYKLENSQKLFDFIVAESPTDQSFAANLLEARNRLWIPKIEKAAAEKPTFFAVGGGHLAGPAGVVTLLRAKGYKVEKLKL